MIQALQRTRRSLHDVICLDEVPEVEGNETDVLKHMRIQELVSVSALVLSISPPPTLYVLTYENLYIYILLYTNIWEHIVYKLICSNL